MTVLALHGGGKMARAIVRLARDRDNITIAGIISRKPVSWAGDIAQYESLNRFRKKVDVLVDFTLPDGLEAAVNWCLKHNTPLLCGTTGLSEEHYALLDKASKSVAVLQSVNLSTGISVVRMLAEALAGVMGESAKVDIKDIHHGKKKDAPSGTALMLGKAIAASRQQNFEDVARIDGLAGKRRKKDDIVFSSVRDKSEIGQHHIRFTLAGEHIEIRHQAGRRTIYADGAISAAEWLARQPAGLYSTRDFLTARAAAS